MSENIFKKLNSIQTKDGSPTLEIEGLEETYHSRHGAVQESMHVFIKNGLQEVAKQYKSVKILEVGLGTGLNLLLTYLFAKEFNDLSIHYHALEKYPLESKLNESLDFSESIIGNKLLTDVDEIKKAYNTIINSSWNTENKLHHRFIFLKSDDSLLEAELKNYDLVYYDAFGPRAQAEMWEIECFEKITPHVNSGGRLVTYCTQGKFRRSLQKLGWEVAKVPGPPGKREMVVAVKTI
jgi:tRNA U34 5-methylaminomethyl-2-thiouridine-forming methyltransferase MnmC